MNGGVRIRLDPVRLPLLFLLTMYADLFLVSIALFPLYPNKQHPGAWALGPPLLCILAACWILFRQLPRLKSRSLKVYRAGLVLTIPSLISLLANVDWILSKLNADNFHGLVTQWDAVYFTITTMATVGYGDIYPTSQLARFWVTAQIVLGVAFIGFVIQREIMSGRD